MKKKEIPVVYIITKLELGGAQKVCLSLVDGLKKNGHKSFLVTGDQGTLIDKQRKNPDTYLLKNLKREVSFKALALECKAFIDIVSHLKTLKKEYPKLIVHTHSTKAGLIGRWAALCAGISTRIHTVHGFGFHPYQHPLGWLINFILEWLTSWITTHYICVSSSDLKTGIRLLPNFMYKSSIIRAAVPLATFKSFPVPSKSQETPHEFVFGTISCFKKQKNLIDMLEAFLSCYKKNQNIRLEIIGDGEQRPLLQDWIKKYSLDSHVQLLGWQDQVPKIMCTWNAFVLSSLWEGLPCAVVEARSLHLPVIAYDTGGIHDIIFHNQNGILCHPKNKHELATAMYELVTKQEIYEKLKNFHDNLDDFDEHVMIHNHINLYRSFRH